MRILITGGAGFIGSHTAVFLEDRQKDVLVVDNFSTGKTENLRDFLQNIEVSDIRDIEKMNAVFKDFRPEAVLHLAGQSAISTAWESPELDLSVNGEGTLIMLRLAQRYNVKKFVFSSTSAVYGKQKYWWNGGGGGFLNENMPANPDTPYGISKLAAENYVRLLFPNHVILRYANIYGPRQDPIGMNQVIARAFRHFIHGDDFAVVGDGYQTRDFVYVGDVCAANYLALVDDATGTFNVASGKSYSVNEVLREIEKVYGVPGYKWEHTSEPDERGNVYMNGNLIRKILGWKPAVSLELGIRLTAKAWESE